MNLVERDVISPVDVLYQCFLSDLYASCVFQLQLFGVSCEIDRTQIILQFEDMGFFLSVAFFTVG
jgi:hypothetical protein